MAEPRETPEELMRKISDADQLASSIAGTAKTAALMFRTFQEEGMTRREALAITQAWLVAIVGRMRDTKS